MNTRAVSFTTHPILLLAVTALYFVSGWIGLQLAIPPGFATAVFPASGIALAFVLRFGPRLLPGVFLGSLLLNLVISFKGQFVWSNLAIAMGIGFGATAQTALGWWLLKTYTVNQRWQRDSRTVFWFLLLCGPVASLVNSTASVLFLWSQGIVGTADLTRNWILWWTGDTIGALVFAPLTLSILENPILRWTYRKTLIVIPSFILFVAIVIFYIEISRQLSETIRLEFHQRVQNNSTLVSSYIEKYKIALIGLQQAMQNRILSRDEFHDYCQPLLQELAGIQSFQWSPLVPDQMRVAFEKQTKHLMPSGFREAEPATRELVIAKKRDFYYPTLYSEPAESNKSMLGFDIGANPERRALIENAFRTRQPVVSPVFNLVRDHNQYGKKGIIWIFPVFADAQKTQAAGVLVGVFRIQEFVLAALGETHFEKINFMMSDHTDGGSEHLYTFSQHGKSPLNYEQLKSEINPSLISSNVIKFGNRLWMMDIFPADRQTSASDLTAWSLFVIGLSLVVLLQSLLILTAGRTDLIQELVDRKTSQIQSLLAGQEAVKLKLRDQQNFLTTILDNLPVALFCKDVNENFTFSLWNKKASVIFGRKPDQMIGRTDYECFAKDQADFFRKRDLETMRGAGALEIPEESLDGPDGRMIVRTQKVPIFDAAGKPRYLLAISEDITKQKESEKTIAAQKLLIIQSDRMKALGEMAGGIAHEINNPLAIIGQAASLLRTLGDQVPVNARELGKVTQLIESTTQRIAKIIRGLRTIARDAEDDPMERVNVRMLVEESIELCKSRFAAHSISLSVKIPKAELEVSGRKAQLAQVLVNLLNNSFDAVDGQAKSWVSIEAARRNNLIEISVTDSGKGVPTEITDKIMQPFFSTKEVGKGTGLGLSISLGIVKSHFGELFLDRQSAHTRFIVQLPSAKNSESEVA